MSRCELVEYATNGAGSKGPVPRDRGLFARPNDVQMPRPEIVDRSPVEILLDDGSFARSPCRHLG